MNDENNRTRITERVTLAVHASRSSVVERAAILIESVARHIGLVVRKTRRIAVVAVTDHRLLEVELPAAREWVKPETPTRHRPRQIELLGRIHGNSREAKGPIGPSLRGVNNIITKIHGELTREAREHPDDVSLLVIAVAVAVKVPVLPMLEVEVAVEIQPNILLNQAAVCGRGDECITHALEDLRIGMVREEHQERRKSEHGNSSCNERYQSPRG